MTSEALGQNPLRLEMFTTWPFPDSMRWGKNAFVPLITPSRLTPKTRS